MEKPTIYAIKRTEGQVSTDWSKTKKIKLKK